MSSIFVDIDQYSALRVESREALHRLGVPSNIGFTDLNILDALAGALVLEYKVQIVPEEHVEFTPEFFKDNLGTILGLEHPIGVSDVLDSLRNTR